MDALEAIQTRRSVRRYVTRQIDDEIVEQLLSAAMSAPSAANEQPWEFIVIKDREMLDGIPAFSPYARMTTHAPLGILVCADTRNVIVPGFWVQDCSAATQNLLIAAHALGLGAVWTGVYPMDDRMAGFTKHCQLPEGVVPLAFVVVGYPAETPPPQNRFNQDKGSFKRVVIRTSFNLWPVGRAERESVYKAEHKMKVTLLEHLYPQ